MPSKNKKSKLPKTFPCKCGHAKKFHDYAGPPIGEEWCNFEESKKADGVYSFIYRCDCESYVPDNLKYLEQKCKQMKGKGH